MQDYASLLALIAGIVTWASLNRRAIRGDYAVTLLAVAFMLLYCLVRLATAALHPLFLCISISTLYLVSLACSTIIYRVSPFHPLAAYPSPFAWSASCLILSFISFQGKRHIVLDYLHKRYGKFVRIGPNVLSVTSVAAGSIIYGATHHMEKSEYYRRSGHSGGVALFFKSGRIEHTKRKKIWNRAFTISAIEDYFPSLEQKTWQLMDCLDRRKNAAGAVDLVECIAHWSYDVMGDVIFGGSNELELMKKGDPQRLLAGAGQGLTMFDNLGHVPWLMDIVWHLPAGQNVYRLFHVTALMMRKRREIKHVTNRDLSSYLLEGDPHTGELISMSDLEDDAAIATQSASDTTASAMMLCMYFLLAHPSEYKTLQAELDKQFPDAAARLSYRLLANIPHLDAVINEAMRLSPTLYTPRIVPEGGVMIEGSFIPAGTIVAVAGYSQQVSADNFFPDPLEYRPQRWLPGGLGPGSVLDMTAFLPFSTGPFVCVAKNLAIAQMRLAVARLVLTFDMRFPQSFDAKAFFDSLRSRRTADFDGPMLVQATRRSAAVNLFCV